MNQAERERRHRANLDRVNQVQLVVGTGDRARVDHEGTLLERARLMVEEIRSHEATERALAAFERLLRLAEEGGHARGAKQVADFIAAVWEDQPMRPSALRAVAADLGDDMLAVLDGLRYSRIALAEHVRGGPRRVVRLLEKRKAALA
ncbi:hypothetical protein EZ313_07365 [Ramlibacter henchirensis]|uniref:DUF7673 domain-containing protein n=1 Tax=Ramlibacter henchirensis TaxID=204072 RepID=A0A4Z0C4B9_9BURK|nr:hypothetical protein [Ramlibacter henchirensis]TFZ06446.1 hypothetical protein EZ313_07365 [Ramlibacter henchirensis]